MMDPDESKFAHSGLAGFSPTRREIHKRAPCILAQFVTGRIGRSRNIGKQTKDKHAVRELHVKVRISRTHSFNLDCGGDGAGEESEGTWQKTLRAISPDAEALRGAGP